MFNLQEMYERLKDNPYFQYLSLKDNYEDELKHMSREEQMTKWKAQTEALKPYMNKYTNPYINISHVEDKLLYSFIPGDDVIIQEKIDGSNSHLIVTSNGFSAFGMNYELNEHNHLQGFYFWCKNHYKNVKPEYYNLKIYGEWLIPHHCDYEDKYYCNFYVFDIMDGNNYLSQDKVEEFCNECGFSYVPTLYKGKFISWEWVKSFVGQSKMATGTGEGIVIKNMSKLNKANKLFYLKLVDTEYQETNPSREIIKTITYDLLHKADLQAKLAETVVTEARIRKQILKLVDARLLPTNWTVIDTSKIFKQIKGVVVKDCYKEQRDVIEQVGKHFPQYAEAIIINYINKCKEEAGN